MWRAESPYHDLVMPQVHVQRAASQGHFPQECTLLVSLYDHSRLCLGLLVLTARLQVCCTISASAIDWDEQQAENSMSSCTGEGGGGGGDGGGVRGSG